MKKSVIILLVFSLLLLPFHQVNAAIEHNDLVWGSGTSVRLTGEIASEKLTDDMHTLGIAVMLLSLNETAVEVYNVRVDYRIYGPISHFYGYIPLSGLSTINSSSQTNVLFHYDSLWENCSLELKISLSENNTISDDPTFVTDWIVYFNLEPYEEPTTPEPTETPTYTTEPDNGF
ncbi:MAG: hypothetical protein ACTSQF_16310, partial [Candidatus Heimdallarchaeaceae archaeon]